MLPLSGEGRALPISAAERGMREQGINIHKDYRLHSTLPWEKVLSVTHSPHSLSLRSPAASPVSRPGFTVSAASAFISFLPPPPFPLEREKIIEPLLVAAAQAPSKEPHRGKGLPGTAACLDYGIPAPSAQDKSILRPMACKGTLGLLTSTEKAAKRRKSSTPTLLTSPTFM